MTSTKEIIPTAEGTLLAVVVNNQTDKTTFQLLNLHFPVLERKYLVELKKQLLTLGLGQTRSAELVERLIKVSEGYQGLVVRFN